MPRRTSPRHRQAPGREPATKAAATIACDPHHVAQVIPPVVRASPRAGRRQRALRPSCAAIVDRAYLFAWCPHSDFFCPVYRACQSLRPAIPPARCPARPAPCRADRDGHHRRGRDRDRAAGRPARAPRRAATAPAAGPRPPRVAPAAAVCAGPRPPATPVRLADVDPGQHDVLGRVALARAEDVKRVAFQVHRQVTDGGRPGGKKKSSRRASSPKGSGPLSNTPSPSSERQSRPGMLMP